MKRNILRGSRHVMSQAPVVPSVALPNLLPIVCVVTIVDI